MPPCWKMCRKLNWLLISYHSAIVLAYCSGIVCFTSIPVRFQMLVSMLSMREHENCSRRFRIGVAGWQSGSDLIACYLHQINDINDFIGNYVAFDLSTIKCTPLLRACSVQFSTICVEYFFKLFIIIKCPRLLVRPKWFLLSPKYGYR